MQQSSSVDVVVIGAGPAGLQAAYFLKRRGLSYAVLEAADRVGDFFGRYPRSRRLISFNKPHTIHSSHELQLRSDWNSLLSDERDPMFRDFSADLLPEADALVDYLAAFAARHSLDVRLGTRVQQISRSASRGFETTTQGGEVWRSPVVVVATGFSLPHIPSIAGIDLAEDYETASVEPRDYEGQTVLLLGKGNSSLELADRLVGSAALVYAASPGPLRLAWQSRHAGHGRSHYLRLLDMYQLKLLDSFLDGSVTRLWRDGDKINVELAYSRARGEQDVLAFDRVIRCTGFRFDNSIFAADCDPGLVRGGKLPEMTPQWESTRTPNLFFAGTLMQSQDFKRAASAFIDGFRYNIRALCALVDERVTGTPPPGRRLAQPAPAALADALLRRASESSGLWVQFGQLADVFVPCAEGTELYEELPLAAVGERFRSGRAVTLHFEWGSEDVDLLLVERNPTHEAAADNAFLHPVVTVWDHGEAVATHHVLEDLVGSYHPDYTTSVVLAHNGVGAAEYHRSQHVAPLVAFLASHLHVRADGQSMAGRS